MIYCHTDRSQNVHLLMSIFITYSKWTLHTDIFCMLFADAG